MIMQKIIEKKNTSALYYKMPNYLGKNKFRKTDIFNAARVDRVKLEESSYKNILQLSKGFIEKNAVYFIDNNQHLLYLKLILKNNSMYHFYFRDRIWILVNKKIIEKNLIEVKNFNKVKAKFLPYNEKKYLEYSLDDSYHSIGWQKTKKGIITRGYLSTLLFSINKNSCNKKTLLNIEYNKKNNWYLNNNNKVNIILNKSYIKQVNLSDLESNIFNLKIPCNNKSNDYLIEFEILNPTSLREVKQGLNPQKLGFEILSMELLN